MADCFGASLPGLPWRKGCKRNFVLVVVVIVVIYHPCSNSVVRWIVFMWCPLVADFVCLFVCLFVSTMLLFYPGKKSQGVQKLEKVNQKLE